MKGVNVTVVPPGYVPIQSPPQLMPVGFDVTVPAPVPFLLTVTVIGWGGITVKVAVTVALVDATQAPAPAQPPPFQPVKTEPASAAAVNVTRVPPGYVPVQSPPQVIPAGVRGDRACSRAILIDGNRERGRRRKIKCRRDGGGGRHDTGTGSATPTAAPSGEQRPSAWRRRQCDGGSTRESFVTVTPAIDPGWS